MTAVEFLMFKAFFPYIEHLQSCKMFLAHAQKHIIRHYMAHNKGHGHTIKVVQARSCNVNIVV